MDAAPQTSPATPLDPWATIRALEDDAVVRWWQTTACLQVAGPDATTFLDGLCTQAVARIDVGRAVPGLFLDAKARIVAPAVLHALAPTVWVDARGGTVDEAPRLLLETLPEHLEPLAAHLRRYRLRARASIDVADASSVAVVGAAAHRAPGQEPAELAGGWTDVAGQARPTRAFLGSREACHELVSRLLPARGFALADPDALEADRIDHGVAGLHDLRAGRMPAEVGGMDAAVALDAGCYLGQEPVARLHYRGRANRGLRRVEGPAPVAFEQEGGTTAADALDLRRAADPDRPVGQLTTWAARPDGTLVAFAILRREVEVGEQLLCAGSPVPLRVLDPPAR